MRDGNMCRMISNKCSFCRVDLMCCYEGFSIFVWLVKDFYWSDIRFVGWVYVDRNIWEVF